MSLYQQNFTLLPIPPVTVFSFGNPDTRFLLPDIATMPEMRQFMTRLLILHIDVPSFFTQIYTAASIACFIIIVTVLIVARRMYEQSFWLIRLVRRPSGVIIVPNALLSFTVFEGAFAIVFVAFLWMHRFWFSTNTLEPYGLISWMTLTWTGLWTGPFSAVWGTHFATPQSSAVRADGSYARNKSSFLSNAIVINISAIIMPLLVFATVAIPTFIGENFHTRAMHLQKRWLEQYNNESAFTQDMVQDVQRVWFDLALSCYYSAIGFALWVAYALILGITYTSVSLRLLRSVRRELSKSKQNSHQMSMVATAFVISECQTTSTASRAEDEALNRTVEQWAARNAGQEDVVAAELDLTRTASQQTSTQYSLPGRQPKVYKDDTPTDYADHKGSDEKWKDRKAFVLKLIPNIIAKTAPHPNLKNIPPTRRQQVRDLHKAYRHIVIQTCSIAPGCFCFAGLSMWACMITCSSTEQPQPGGGTQGQHAWPLIILAVSWTTVVLGSITLVSIAQRTYEPVLSNMSWSSSLLKGSGGKGTSGDATNSTRQQAFSQSTSDLAIHTADREKQRAREDDEENAVHAVRAVQSKTSAPRVRADMSTNDFVEPTLSTFFETTSVDNRSMWRPSGPPIAPRDDVESGRSGVHFNLEDGTVTAR